MARITISKKTWKLLLGICIVAVLTMGIGLFAYVHVIDTRTLGRKISIYGLDVSKLTVEEAQEKISRAFLDKKVSFQEDGKEVYNVTLEQLGYALDQDALKNSLETLKQKRDQIRKLFASRMDYKIEYQLRVNDVVEQDALNIGNFGDKERTASTDAEISYDKKNGKFVLVKQVQGNEINESALREFTDQTLRQQLQEKLLTGNVIVQMGTEVYVQPNVKISGSMKKKMKKLNAKLEKYRSTTVAYTFGDTTDVLDSDTIRSWIIVKGTKVSIDKDAAATWISDLANKYNTIYIPRTFKTSTGSEVTIQDNEYGFRIDQESELNQLLEDLKSGEAISREPVYSSSGMMRNGRDDLEGSYIEVSLDAQHLWLYKNGTLVTETDIVSGAPTAERETYRGAWPIAYKASPFTLSSDQYGYATTVKYWMPFVYGQGLHDASWQSAFGGNRYKTGHGSHGCINLPEDQAALIYNTIDGGYPIIIY